MLKLISYRGFSQKSTGEIAYCIWIKANTCVFTGLTSSPCGISTMNAADQIMLAISRAERFFRLIRFYDLQTHCGYPALDPNCYAFDELLWKPYAENITAGREECYLSWRPQPCPSAIESVFRLYLGPHPRQINAPFCASTISLQQQEVFPSAN